MNADGSGVTSLTGSNHAGEPAWSPDGKRVAFTGDNGIWVMNADGSDPKAIRRDPSMVDEEPAWSPDSNQIAFVESSTCGTCDFLLPRTLMIMNPDGSGARKIIDQWNGDRPA